MADRALTPTSHLVLGLVRTLQPCTSYEMKQLVNVSIGNFWPFPHSQLYAEPARLSQEGYLVEEQEESGRRRRLYTLTERGADALHEWVRAPADEVSELRDEGLLKLFFADASDRDAVVELARSQVEVHRAHIAELEDIRDRFGNDAGPAQLATLELGVRWDRTALGFWTEVADDPPV